MSIFPSGTFKTMTYLWFIIPKHFSEELYCFSHKILPSLSRWTIVSFYSIASRRRITKVSLYAVETQSILGMGGFSTSLFSCFRSMLFFYNKLIISTLTKYQINSISFVSSAKFISTKRRKNYECGNITFINPLQYFK